jgi:Fic family protein
MIIDYNNKIIEYSKYRVTDYPVHHRSKVPFGPIFRLNIRYRQVIEQIREAESQLSKMILSDADYRSLVVSTYSTKVQWSVKVEGNDLPIHEVKRLSMLFSREGVSEERIDGSSREIFNHMYSYFIKSEFNLPWTMSTVLNLHNILMQNVDSSEGNDRIRTEPTSFIGKDGFEYYVACPANKIEEEMESLLTWLRYSPFDELITSIIFFHEFESIHPFTNGNGRTGRTLFQMLLQEMGLKNSKVCKIEQELLKDEGLYYSLLIYTDATQDYCPLIMYISEALLRSYKEAVAQFSEKDLSKKMDRHMIELVNRSKTVDEFSVTEASSWLSDLSEQSVRIKLNELVEMNVLEKEGHTRAQRFRFKDPFRKLKAELKVEVRG